MLGASGLTIAASLGAVTPSAPFRNLTVHRAGFRVTWFSFCPFCRAIRSTECFLNINGADEGLISSTAGHCAITILNPFSHHTIDWARIRVAWNDLLQGRASLTTMLGVYSNGPLLLLLASSTGFAARAIIFPLTNFTVHWAWLYNAVPNLRRIA
jgi:hypothetical protein